APLNPPPRGIPPPRKPPPPPPRPPPPRPPRAKTSGRPVANTRMMMTMRSPLPTRSVMSHLLIGRVSASVARLTADRLISLAGGRRAADQGKAVRVGHGLPANRPVERL